MQDNIILQSISDLYIKNVIYFYNGTIRVFADVLKTEMCFPPPRADYFSQFGILFVSFLLIQFYCDIWL